MKGLMIGVVEVEGREGVQVAFILNGTEQLVTSPRHALSLHEQLGVILEQLGMFPDELPREPSEVVH